VVVIAAATGTAGADPGRFRWSIDTPVTIQLVDVTPSGEFMDALTVEAHRWNAARLPVQFAAPVAHPGATCDTSGTTVAVCRQDSGPDHPGAQALTWQTTYDGTHFYSEHITVAPTVDFARVSMRALLGHEMGHVLGLDHTQYVDPSSIMCPGVQDHRTSGLPGPQDYADVRAMYGATTPFTTPTEDAGDQPPGRDYSNVAAPDGTVPDWAADPQVPATTPTTAAHPAHAAAPHATRATPHPTPTTAPAPVAGVSIVIPPGAMPILSTRW
jgi:hypothetical protein